MRSRSADTGAGSGAGAGWLWNYSSYYLAVVVGIIIFMRLLAVWLREAQQNPREQCSDLSPRRHVICCLFLLSLEWEGLFGWYKNSEFSSIAYHLTHFTALFQISYNDPILHYNELLLLSPCLSPSLLSPDHLLVVCVVRWAIHRHPYFTSANRPAGMRDRILLSSSKDLIFFLISHDLSILVID